MLYDIHLRIDYAFDTPTGGGRHLLRLLPADLPGVQHLISARIAVQPRPVERSEFSDYFGNRVTEVAVPAGQDEIVFTASARVERLARPPEADLTPPLTELAGELAALTDFGPASPHHFLGASPRIRPVAAITAYAAGIAAAAPTTREAVRGLGLALHRDMAFDPEATTVDTPPDEAFAVRSGVCQDFAQVMIAGLRGIGVPAAYVSGYLRTVPPPGRPRLEGADAMHAWVRAWCGRSAGWVEFDPTNAMFVAADHITVACGRDYGEAAPVAGVLRLAGSQTSRQAVDVIVRQPAPAGAS
jgi:transglutaminase-like putative cysteine protease